MKKKGGLELSVNFLVMLILAVICFGMGLFIIFTLSDELGGILNIFSENFEERLEIMLIQEGHNFAIPFNVIELRRGDNSRAAYGIKNRHSEFEDFKVIIECATGYNKSSGGGYICINPSECDDICGDWVQIPYGDINIERRGLYIDDLYIVVPEDAQAGSYVFNLVVKTNSEEGFIEQYGTNRRFTVEVIEGRSFFN